MERLQEALEGDAEDNGALKVARPLIERIELHPLDGSGFEIEVMGDIAAMIRLTHLGGGTRTQGAPIPGRSDAVPDVFA